MDPPSKNMSWSRVIDLQDFAPKWHLLSNCKAGPSSRVQEHLVESCVLDFSSWRLGSRYSTGKGLRSGSPDMTVHDGEGSSRAPCLIGMGKRLPDQPRSAAQENC